jgi:hypothetical protein
MASIAGRLKIPERSVAARLGKDVFSEPPGD